MILTTEKYNDLKNKISKECRSRRKYNKQLSSIWFNDASKNNIIKKTQLNALINPILIIKGNDYEPFQTLKNCDSGSIVVNDLKTLEEEWSKIINCEDTAAKHGCNASCTGLCSVDCGKSCGDSCIGTCDAYCQNSCYNDCTKGCKGTCTSCTGTCTGCTGTCTGSCGNNCVGGCGDDCYTGCFDTCKAQCSSNCDTDCLGCEGTCLGTCFTGVGAQ